MQLLEVGVMNMNRHSRRALASIAGVSALAAPALILPSRDLVLPERPGIVRADAGDLKKLQHNAVIPGFGTAMMLQSNALDTTLYGIINAAGLATNLKLCLDAGDSASYSGSGQTWTDRSSSATNFYRGLTSSSSTDDPTFNGSAGGKSSSEYFSTDQTKAFAITTGVAPAWLNTMYKDGAVYTILAAVYYAATPHYIFSNQSGSVGPGVGFNILSGSQQLIVVSGASSVLTKSGDTTTSLNTWNILGVSVTENGGSTGAFLYRNGNYNQVSASNTWDPDYSAPATFDTSYPPAIFARYGDPSNNLGSGAKFGSISGSGNRIGWLAVWQGTALTKANMDTLYASLKTRYGLS